MTQRWIRNASDERAAANGYWFDEELGQAVVDWIQQYCCLYEGVRVIGEPMILGDWQYDCTMRMFGWVHRSPRWGIVRRFKKASIWVPKKNTKSPTLAAWGLYLFCGDSEPGQKVFSMARDGRQAMTSHRHAIEMVKMFPGWEDDFTINGSSGQIFHKPTLSTYSILAGDNPESQEGINGCVMVDETHVVTRKLAEIVRNAGISRSQPFHIEVSTAGNDPTGYGKEQYDKGKRVEAGVEDVPHLFFQAYEAPQTTTPESLSDPKVLIELGRKANPTWGRIIQEEEFVATYQECRSLKSTLLNFMMYRLNVWQQSVNPWLSLDAWDKCKQTFTLDDLLGRDCWAALDLSSIKDMTSLSLCFPEADGSYRSLWWFWLPRQTAEENKDTVPFINWSADKRCQLELTAGNRIEPERVMKKMAELSKLVNIRELAFDPWHGEMVTRAISEGMAIDGKVLFEGLGIPRSDFSQTVTKFTEPTKNFERLIMAGKFHHNGDPIMAWQVGHVSLYSDANNNCKPQKPEGKKDDVRKIDGVIAGVMALAAAERGRSTSKMSWYNDHSLEFV